MKNTRFGVTQEFSPGGSKAKDMFISERSLDPSSSSNMFADGKTSHSSAKQLSEWGPSKTSSNQANESNNSVRKVKVGNLRLKQSQSDQQQHALRRSPLKFGSPDQSSRKKSGFIRKIFDFFSPSRKRSGSAEKYKVQGGFNFEEEEDEKKDVGSAPLSPKIKMMTDSNIFKMGNSVEEQSIKGESNQTQGSLLILKKKEVPLAFTFSARKRLNFKHRESQLQDVNQVSSLTQTFGKFQPESKRNNEPLGFSPVGVLKKESNAEGSKTDKFFTDAGFSKQFSKQISASDFRNSIDLPPEETMEKSHNRIPKHIDPRLMSNQAPLPNFRKQRSLSPQKRVTFKNTEERGSPGMPLFKRAPSPEDLPYLATDKDTGSDLNLLNNNLN